MKPEMERKLMKTQKALDTMYLVRDRIVEKLASSTTGAQAHIGLLTQTENDIEKLKGILSTLQKMAEPVKEPKRSYTKKEG